MRKTNKSFGRLLAITVVALFALALASCQTAAGNPSNTNSSTGTAAPTAESQKVCLPPNPQRFCLPRRPFR